EGLTRHFRVGKLFAGQVLHAVDDVSFTINRGEIVALVGESGSGKSTIARLLARVYTPTRGEIYFEGRPLSGLRTRKDRLAYASAAPMVFRAPSSPITPASRVAQGIRRVLKRHRRSVERDERRREAERVMGSVGLVPPGAMLGKFPHELSGGQRQRI